MAHINYEVLYCIILKNVYLFLGSNVSLPALYVDTCNLCFYLFFLLQEDYRLLEAMNRATISKYSDMKQIAGNVARTMIDLNDKCK